MGQCVLRDCGLDQPTPPSRLESILKQHLQEKYYEGFIEKHANGIPVKDKDFNSSLDYPKTRTILPKKVPKRDWKEGEGEDEEKEEIHLQKQALSTKKVTPLIHKELDLEEKSPQFKPFTNENYAKPTTSELGFEEDFLMGSLSIDDQFSKAAKTQNKSRVAESVKPLDQNNSNIFQNQIFENVNTTPSAMNYRSDDENLGEYEKIFQDDEFLNSSEDEDYVKKLKNG